MLLLLVPAGLAMLIGLMLGLRQRRLAGLRASAAVPRDLATGRVVRDTALESGGLVAVGTAAEALVQYREMMSQTADAQESLADIDPSVIQGISSASARIPGTSDPSVMATPESFMEWFGDNVGTVFDPAIRDRLVGYVGEVQAFDELEAQGHLVEAAVSANQPVWDALVNGEMVNVKTHQSLYSVNGHAGENPEVTYLVPEDVVGSTDLPNIVGLSGFSNAQVRADYDSSMSAAGQSLDHQGLAAGVEESLVSGDFAMDALTGPVPLGLVAFTAYRQVKAVRDGKRWEHALVDGGFDVAVRGVGMAAGGAAGAQIGASVDLATGGLLLAVPTVAGTIGGAVAGSTAGAAGLNWWRNRHIRAAQEQLEQALENYAMEFYDDDSISRLGAVAVAPLERSRQTNVDLYDEFQRCKGLRWWLWPGADQVLREQAVVSSAERYEDMEQRVEQTIDRVSRVIGSPRDYGLMLATSPALAARLQPDRDTPPGALLHLEAASGQLQEAVRQRRFRG